MATLPETMKAVIFDGPYAVSVQDRAVPKITDDRDIIVKVHATALCGSELHVYRGHQPSGTGFIMGHEFTGTIVQAGPAVKTVKVGDKIVSPFTASCGECFYCANGATSRCVDSLLFGSAKLDGGQAEYVRVPMADGTVVKAPTSISDQALVLMADIFPTGYFGVKSAIELRPNVDISQATIAVIGCGPVGICAAICALNLKVKHCFVIDNVDSRLKIAEGLGAKPLNFNEGVESMKAKIGAVTEGRGADFVVEVVGLSPALRTAFELIRPFGAISSIGVHNAEIPMTGAEGYAKNIRLQMGRCPVRSIFPEALEILGKVQDKVQFMFDNQRPLADAQQSYVDFDKMKVHKVVFLP